MRLLPIYLLTLILVVSKMALMAQPSSSFHHYSLEDGLPQLSITDILQDQKGFIWLATFDGISKFDGYRFHNYKPKPGDSYPMKSNRIDHIYEDVSGGIWLHSYAGEAHYFDPQDEAYWGLTSLPDSTLHQLVVKKIDVKTSGWVWVLFQEKGLVAINRSKNLVRRHFDDAKWLNDRVVNLVHEDQQGNTWVLSDDGLLKVLDKGLDTCEAFFHNDIKVEQSVRFMAVAEFSEEIWFGGNKGQIKQYHKSKQTFNNFQLPVLSDVNYIAELNENQVIISTLHDGFFTYNRRTDALVHYNSETINGLKTNDLHIIYIRKPNLLWFVNNDVGIFQYCFNSQRLSHYIVPTEDVAVPIAPAVPFVIEDQEKRLWVHPRGGGFSLYNEKDNSLEPFYNSPLDANSRFSNILHSAYFDRSGMMWFSSRLNGLEKVVFNRNDFRAIQIDQRKNVVNQNNVRAIFEDEHENLWVSTRGNNRLAIFDKNLQLKGFLSQNGQLTANARWQNTIYCMLTDSRGNIWLGTRGDGIFHLTPKTKHGLEFDVVHYKNESNNPYSLSENNVYSIYEDINQHIWIATFGGGINFVDISDLADDVKFLHPFNDLKRFPIEHGSKVRCVAGTSNGIVYIGTTNGLIVCDTNGKHPNEFEFHHFTRQAASSNSLSSNDIFDICITRDSEVYLGTSGGGINKVSAFDEHGLPRSFISFMKSDGLPSDMVQTIIEDQKGNLWIGMQNELARFHPKTGFFEVFGEAKRLLANQIFSEAAKILTHNGELLFGFVNGILAFPPEQIRINNFSPYLAFTNFRLFNERVTVNHPNGLLPIAVDLIEEITLGPKQNFFSVEYAALDYENPDNIHYAYMLEGFDPDWNYVQKQRIANYTNVPRGKYTLRVKSTNSEGVWAENERQLIINVKPSFWQTPFAYVLYFMFFALIIFFIDYSFLTIYRLKTNMKVEKKISEMKLKFFTDISHEIRTPLTLITAPVEYMMNDPRTPEVMKKQMLFISQNTNRMMRLVNQILDLRKLQDMQLIVSEIALSHFVRDIFSGFSEMADEQGIEFTLVDKAPESNIWAHKESIEKMLMNLLSNAFKHGAAGKKIEVSVLADDKSVTVSVLDKGSGISKERMKNLFQRFNNFTDDPTKPSTGIGLSLVKELAEKHGAKVIVESEQGRGSCFRIQFQKGRAHFSDTVQIVQAEEAAVDYHFADKEKSGYNIAESNDRRPVALIVEDDNGLRSFIAGILEQEYQVLLAEDGEQGWELAISQNPDLIVSDIMMPRLDGIGLLKRIRNSMETSHIPLILLTAKTDVETQLEGLSYGADDYITKPFSVAYFKTRMANLITQRKRLQDIFGSGFSEGTHHFGPKPCLIASYDEKLMETVVAAIEENIDNGEFSVEALAGVAGMGRSTFFNKIKGLTGLSPVEFIRDIRIKRAAQLLSQGNYLIKEAAFMTGFSDTKYFGKCFKAKYGITPLEYRNQKR